MTAQKSTGRQAPQKGTSTVTCFPEHLFSSVPKNRLGLKLRFERIVPYRKTSIYKGFWYLKKSKQGRFERKLSTFICGTKKQILVFAVPQTTLFMLAWVYFRVSKKKNTGNQKKTNKVGKELFLFSLLAKTSLYKERFFFLHDVFHYRFEKNNCTDKWKTLQTKHFFSSWIS